MDAFTARFNQALVTTYRSILKVEEVMLRDLSGGNLTISEMHILESIGKSRGEGMHISDIAQEQGITLPSVTMAVKKLEKKGYVTKVKNASDARRVCVYLTEPGRRAEIAHRYFHRKMVKAITRPMTQEERELMLSGLDRLNAFLAETVARRDQAEDSGE